MDTTQKFKRLPPLAGVHFAGFKDVKIESRQSVVKQLRDFTKYCLREAKSPAVQVILGEWGEGKTEAYQRYIQPEIKEPNCTYLVSASTIAQSLSRVQVESPLASLNFLASVFYAIQHEAKAERIPPLERFRDTGQWLEGTLQAHAKGKVLIFIDEFEELILNSSALRSILSGLKELINKQYRPVTEEGQYPGIISFLLSCTPDAYARMQRDSEIAEVFGSWERRTSKIQLTPVTKREGVKFLCDLLSYAYDYRLPEPLPIKDLGVFYTLQTIGRGNLGALVTLFVKVFNSATIDEETVHVIDGFKLLDILSGETVSVYGGTAKCVEYRLLQGLEEALDEREKKLLRVLAGELRPFSTSELAARLNIPDSADVSALVGRANQKLVNLGVANAVVRFAPLLGDCSFQDVHQALQSEMREDEIQIDGFTQRLGELEDDLTFLHSCGNQLVPRVFFPWDYRMISTAFEGITPDSARRLGKRVNKIIDPSDAYYRLSNELVLQLFPTPIPVGLEFIKDRDLRLKMWRDTTARFPQLFRDDVLRAFLSLMQYVDAFDIEADNLRTAGNGLAVTIKDGPQNATIRCYCRAHYGDLGPSAVLQVEDGLREVPDAHLALVIHIGDITGAGDDEIRAREMEDRILRISLHTSLAKRLLIAYQCKTAHPKDVDDRLFTDSVTRLFKVEVEFGTRIRRWLEQGVKAGIVLKDLYKATARGERDLADSLKFYANRLGESDTPEKIFQANERLMGFVPFGTRPGFIPDIESPNQLRKYTDDLAQNGFICWNTDGTVRVTRTPPEERLLRIIETAKTMAKSSLGGHFINCAQARNIVEDVYVSILEHKGVVRESRGLLSLVKIDKALEEAARVRKAYQERLTACKQQEEWAAFAHILVTKQRAFRFIDITDLGAYLDDLYETVHKAAQQGQEDVVLQRAALLDTLAEHLQTALMPKIDGAIREARHIKDNALSQVDSLLEDVEDVAREYNKWLKQNATPDNVREVKELSAGKACLWKICKCHITLSDISEEEKKDAVFASSWSTPDQYFSVALRRLQESTKSLQQRAGQCATIIGDIRKALKSLEEAGQGTRSRLLTIQVAEKYRLSRVVRAQLETSMEGISAENATRSPQLTDAVSPALTLGKMLEDLRELSRPVEERYKKADEAIRALPRLVEIEAKFCEAATNCLTVHQTLSERADVELFQAQVQELGDNRTQVLKDYELLVSQLSKSSAGEVVSYATISRIQDEVRQRSTHLQEISKGLRQVWSTYAATCEHFVGSIHRLIQLAKKRDSSLMADHIETECKDLMRVANLVGEAWGERSMSYYEALKVRIRGTTIALLKKTLDETEGIVLMAVIDRREQSKSGWFNLSQITQEITDELALSDAEIEKRLHSLVEKGYLSEGIAIPL